MKAFERKRLSLKFIIQENERVLALASAQATGEHTKAGRLAVRSFEGARDLYEIVSCEMIAMIEKYMSKTGIEPEIYPVHSAVGAGVPAL